MRNKDDSTPIPEQRCWKCGYKMDATSPAIGNAKPSEGDISMCLSCGAVTIFTKDFSLRKPTPDEEAMALKHPVLIHAQIVRASMVGDKLKGRK